MSQMKMTTLYVDENTLAKVQSRLAALNIEAPKGAVAATVRVMLRLFADNRPLPPPQELAALIDAEYTYTAKKNKRSKL